MSWEDNEKEFQRLRNEKQDWYNGGYATGADSNLTPAETLGYYDLQKMSDDEYNKFSQAVKSNSSPTIDTSSIINDDKPGIGTAVMNGLKGSVRGLFGAAKAAIDANIEAHKGDKNVVKEYDQSENISKALGYVTDEILKREEVKADTAAGQLGYDLAENGIQLLAQLALTKGVGAAGATAKTVHAISMLYNGANISGEQYLRLRKEGVSASRAAEAGLMNAIPQAVLEELPLGRLLKKMPAGSGLKAKIWEVTKRGLEEGVTEALQEFPEQATDLWAKNPGASTAKLSEKWGENWQQNLKEAGYSGLIGAILGGSVSGVSVAVDSAVEHVALKANEERKAKLVADAERIRETGINPERAAAEIEANNPNFEDDTVTVSAQDLEGYKQTSSNNKLFDELGVTAEEVATAAELGQDIDISRGKFTAAMAKDNALFEATKDNMYFDSNGELSDGGAKTRKELREGYNLTRLASTELDAELDAIVDSATKAGMNKSHAGNLRLVLESRALIADPENPAAWLQKNKLRFEDGGKGTAGRKQRGWTQKVWGRAKGWKQNSQTEIKGQFRQADDGTYIIDLFKGADASTAIHETGHYFTETMINEALADPSNTRLNADAKKLMEYAGIDADVWASGDVEAKRAGHEKLAEAFETYIMEGKAPSVGLRGAFQRFANWLSAIYSKIARSENAAELTPEVRQVFDRMLACREEIEVMARMEGIFGGLPENITSKLSDQNKKTLQDKILKAKDKAVDILTRRAMADFSAKRRAEKAAFVEEIRPQIEQAVAQELVNRARHQVGYEFGQEVKVVDSHFIDDEHGMAHANNSDTPWRKTKLANPAIIARKYRHVLGSVLPNYNDMLNDTNASIDDILNPIVEYLQAEVDTYGTLSKERVANAEDMLIAMFSKSRQKTVTNPTFVVDEHGMAHAKFKQKINEWETIEANPRRLARKYIYGNERINYNELLKDTNGAIDDILNPIADRIESELAEYQDTVKSERAFFINGKWGYFAATNRTEGKYANDFAGIPDQSAVLVDFGEIGKDGKRHWTKRALEQADIEGLVFHEAGDSIRNVNWVSRYVHDYGGSVSDLTSKKGRRRIAEKIARGEDIADYYDLRSTGLDYGDAEIKADFKHIVDELDRLQALKHRLETDPEGVDLVKESKRNQLSQEQKELFDQIAEENGYASGYEMAREIVEGYTVNENESSDVQDNWARNYIRNGGDRAKLKSEEGLKEIAETLVEGEQLTELNELKALKHELETNPDKVDLVEMSKKRALTNEQRELFDWVADNLGYDSGDAMAQDILTSPSERTMVRQEIDKAVSRRFPDFMQEREQAREAAREALYNDESGEVVALEQQLIDEALNEISDKDIKQKERENIAKVRKQNADNFAKRYIQTLPAGEVMKPRRFAMAERRAAANANKAAKAGLLEEAAMYKQQQMINHALYREAVKAKHQIESARKYVRKQMHSKKEVWGTEQHFFQMCALLERMGYHRKDFNTNGREVQPLSDYIAEMQAKYGDEIISMPEFVLNPNNDLTNAPQLSLTNYMDVIDALKNIRAIAKQDTQMNKIAAGEAFEQVKADTIAHLQELPVEYEAEIGSDSKKSLRKRIVDWPKNFMATLRNADNFFLMMDNWMEGYFTREFYNKINHCADMESTMLESYQNELIDALQKWEPDKKTGIAHEQRIYYEELGGSADKHALIAMLCNLGSDSNAARLCSQKPVGVKNSDIWVEKSELIGREEAMLQTKQNLIEFLCKHLTKEDIAYAQARINAASKFWPMLAEVNRKTKGFEPPKIEASPLVLKLASGESVVFDGGYFPLERDTRTGSMPGKFDRIDSTEEGSRPPQRTLATNTGSSKARTGGKYPVDLSRGSEVTAVKSTIHDICYRETMLDFRKILNDEDIYRNMVEHLGDTNVRLLREFLQACANPYGNKTAYMAENLFTKAANALRNIATNTAIMLNFKTAMQNFSNILLYGNSVEGFTHADAFRALYRGFTGEGRAEVDAICAKSVFMRERMQVPDVTLRDIQTRSDLNPIEKKTLKYGALLLGYTDMMTAKPVFAEAYMKKINEGKTEQEALDFANAVIRRTLGSSRIHDVSSLQRGSGLFRLFTMFQGFFNTQFNQWDREAHIAKRLWNSGEKKEMSERLIAFVTAKWLAVCLLNVAIAELSLTAPFEKDKKDDWNNLAKELINYPLSMGGPVGQAANVGVQNLLGMRNYGYRLTAAQGLIDRGFTVARRINDVAEGKKEPGELIEQTAYVGGAWLGIPSGIFNIIFNGIDIAADDMDFELQDIYKRRPKSERKKD